MNEEEQQYSIVTELPIYTEPVDHGCMGGGRLAEL